MNTTTKGFIQKNTHCQRQGNVVSGGFPMIIVSMVGINECAAPNEYWITQKQAKWLPYRQDFRFYLVYILIRTTKEACASPISIKKYMRYIGFIFSPGSKIYDPKFKQRTIIFFAFKRTCKLQ